MNKKGISLIVLIITIIVIIILATAIVINIARTNIIGRGNEATFKQDISSMKDELNLYIADRFAEENGKYDSKKLQANEEGIWYGTEQEEGTIYNIIPNMPEKYVGKIFVKDGELTYDKISVTVEEQQWLIDMGINSSTQVDLGIIDITLSTYEWTKDDVTATISYSKEIPEGYILQYKLNEENWIDGNEVIVTENNTKITARIYNKEKDNEALTNSVEVSKIDKEEPEVGTISSEAINCENVNLVINNVSDSLTKISEIIWYYKPVSETTYLSMSTELDSVSAADVKKEIGVESNIEYEVYAEVYDEVGNKSTTETIKVTGNEVHDAIEGGALATEADCWNAVKYHHKCSRCEKQLETTYTVGAGLGHNPVEGGSLATAANCWNPATYYYICSRCSTELKYMTYQSGQGLGHVAVNGGTEAIHSKCSRCDTTLSTTHSYTSTVQTAATCTTKGTTKYTCSCGYSYTSQDIAAIGHSYSATELKDCVDSIKSAYKYSDNTVSWCSAGVYDPGGNIFSVGTIAYNTTSNQYSSEIGYIEIGEYNNGAVGKKYTYLGTSYLINICSRCGHHYH